MTKTVIKAITLTPAKTSLATLEQVWRTNYPVRLAKTVRASVDRAADLVAKLAEGDIAVYGINTGFGKLAHVCIAKEETAKLQRNLIVSHCCGVGEILPPSTTRLMMALKLLSLGRGASGVRWQTIQHIEEMIKRQVLPVIPSQGSVGASGDLAPLAHMAAVMIGEGEAIYEGERLAGDVALRRAGLTPIVLAAKEGLALINGTQLSTASALVGLWQAWDNVRTSIVTGAMTTDAVMGSTAPLNPAIHALRGHEGQIDFAQAQAGLLEGSMIRESHREDDNRVQDPYCIRCQPQVMGAVMNVLRTAARTLKTEANAVTDNPLVLVESGEIVSGGNFHGEPVAFAADQIALATAEIGTIAQRRVALMVDPTLSHDLPPFLVSAPGLNSGFMAAEITTAALMSENKYLATPCSIDSTPTSANQEDHVSMSAHAAHRLHRMNANLSVILAIEALAAAQGIELRQPLTTSPTLVRVLGRLRQKVAKLKDDRYLADDIASAIALVRGGALTQNLALPELEAMP